MPMTRGGRAHGARDGEASSERQADARTARSGPPPLAPNVRRHLGLSLRTFYAATLAEPVDDRIAALLDRLGKASPGNPFP
ncbi:hypothetical protein [Methylobacterium sp. J-090]|uniref:hypothetical protein n=1 Tax=Methylobacterium sp. J-090 TaxID=2836666 RepID=UPI001FB949F7|nr:hypothetical protein [Methylobacterium sp. J-090]MCJ2079756.1 hypothetical protein [Methylobacterium sp. J-090]